jgi:hypothetical protein
MNQLSLIRPLPNMLDEKVKVKDDKLLRYQKGPEYRV